MTMYQELLKRARECRFVRSGLLEFSAELPRDDGILDELIGAAVARRENEAFVRIFFAALGSGRLVDARHLERGACLFDDPGQLAAAALHASGDVPAALIGAVRSEGLGDERAAVALLLAGLWCKDHGVASVPLELIAQARIQARRAGRNLVADLQIAVLSNLLHSEGLTRILDSRQVPPLPPELTSDFLADFIGAARESPLAVVPEHAGPVVLSGFTVRRAVSRIGRNEPCPCGSGKKYKKCCMEKDEVRLQESSSVAGMTVGELRERRESFLTEDELLRMRSYELARLDPDKVAAPLRPLLINRLLLFGEYEAAVELFEKAGVPDALRDHWLDCIDRVVVVPRKDMLVRLLRLRDESERERDDFPLRARLLMADEAHAIRLIEETALKGLQETEPAVALAYALLEGQWPALGILVSHGLIAQAGLFDAEMLLDTIMEARDKLHLSPDDSIQALLDERFESSMETHRDTEELQEAQEKLQVNTRELNDVRAKLTRLQAELEKKEREKKTPPRSVLTAPAPAPPAIIDEGALHELRHRVASLREELRERHNERNQLRGDLKLALDRLEELSRKETVATPAEEADAEDDWLDDTESAGTHPVRIPEFPQKFRASLQELPPRIVRQSMTLIGRMAAGEDGAFAGARRLKASRDIVRQRIGDHRLLFRLHSHTIELLALIPRRDLERRIKSLISA
jgi:mRNA-degrading endonuclease RelE of RelBE toxin-antitoxin system